MLVLTRNANESIMVGDDVEIVVLSISQGQVRLGITAPREIPVHRFEVWDSLKDQKDGEATE